MIYEPDVMRDEIQCERCGHTTFSWGAEVCTWWPEGCQGDDRRVCPDCQTPDEVRELAELGCTAATFRAAIL
ncbi:hypothetical protein SAMN05421748_14446 [Paractinoplanes atraurantiacus]|uniref:Uncharacterized protein n=2 Tax=Paractinoplanes atraurantiacus TaxID=1036182 RepID=A0A285KJX3_9ACTN|nr:hypothetical protein SAMN05421748_14446 [Actinoplanes atraurantiacus]